MKSFMIKVLENPASLTEDEIHAVIRKAVCSSKITPVLCGTAFKNKGIQPLLDAIVAWMPSPLDRGLIKGINYSTNEPMELEPRDDAPLAALAFKIMSDPYVGRLTFVRIYAGTLSKGVNLHNTTKDKTSAFPAYLKCMPTNAKTVKSFSQAISLLASASSTQALAIRSVLKNPPASGENGFSRACDLHGY